MSTKDSSCAYSAVLAAKDMHLHNVSSRFEWPCIKFNEDVMILGKENNLGKLSNIIEKNK